MGKSLRANRFQQSKSREITTLASGPVLSAILALTLALTGYCFTWYQSRIAEQYKAHLTRVETQLRDFYGPLYSLTEAENRAFIEFMVATRPGTTNFWDSSDPPTEEQQAQWRRWIETVSMPNYLAMEDVIQKHADLIVDDQFPESLLNLSAHIAGYKSVIAAWKEGDFSRQYSFMPFPKNVRDHLTLRYVQLKGEQRDLMEEVWAK